MSKEDEFVVTYEVDAQWLLPVQEYYINGT